jgi:hypothetical protein
MKGIAEALFSYRVEYFERGNFFVFNCQAEDHEHAREQCKNANPKGGIAFSYQEDKAAA